MRLSPKRIVLIALAAPGFFATASAQPPSRAVDVVDMLMGTHGDSNCVVGPQTPHGSINPSPHTPHGSHGGYHPDQPIRGFAQLNVTGTGWGRYGQILISPQIGLDPAEEGHDSAKSSETATPYYYAVTLDRYHVRTELAPTAHAAIYRFAFPESDRSTLYIDVTHNIPMHIAPEIHGMFRGGRVEIDPAGRTISGWGEYSGGYGDGVTPYKVFFSAAFDKAPVRCGTADDYRPASALALASTGTALGAWCRFATHDNEPVALRIGVSMKSVENARNYLDAEIPKFDLEAIAGQGRETWDRALSAIEVGGGTETQRKLFYTALYQTQLMPRDRTGDNPHWDSDAPYWDDQYDLWDTWRTVFPLMTLINPAFVRDNVNSFIDRYARNHKVQSAFTSGLDMDWKQGGDEADYVIADAYVKGVPGIDWPKAYEIVRHHAQEERDDTYRRLGWDAEHGERMSCSYELEYAYNDFCAAEIAKGLGKNAEAEAYLARAKKWEMLWDTGTVSDGYSGFIRPRRENLSWVDFDPKKNYMSWNEFFYEANSWTYSYFAPQDIPRLVAISGGPDVFAARLDHALQADLIGIDNEPSFLAVRSFHYAGRPDLTNRWVHKIMDEHYSLDKGYPGNDDSGAMSSWYVFSALGFFPNAGQDLYLLNAPEFPSAVVHLGNGKTLTVTAENLSDRNFYIQAVYLNDRPLKRSWLRHADLMGGGMLKFVMGPIPGVWGTTDLPPSGFQLLKPN